MPRTDLSDAGRSAFLEWAKGALAPLKTVVPDAEWHDLEPFGSMVGDATVVALGEGAIHGCAESLEFRNRVLRYLVREKGFTAIALESGAVEGKLVHEYVRGGPGELSEVLADG